MPTPLSRQSGFSLPEVLLSMVLMIMVITALAGAQRYLAQGAMQLNHSRQLVREGWRQTQRLVSAPPAGWQSHRVQTSRQRCVSITVRITTPAGRQGQMSRLHCPKN